MQIIDQLFIIEKKIFSIFFNSNFFNSIFFFKNFFLFNGSKIVEEIHIKYISERMTWIVIISQLNIH